MLLLLNSWNMRDACALVRLHARNAAHAGLRWLALRFARRFALLCGNAHAHADPPF
jgi:hypothetical protein